MTNVINAIANFRHLATMFTNADTADRAWTPGAEFGVRLNPDNTLTLLDEDGYPYNTAREIDDADWLIGQGLLENWDA